MSDRDIFSDDTGEVDVSVVPQEQLVQSPPPIPPPLEEDGITTLRDDEVNLLQWHQKGKKIIAVIGFYDSGKTFFVNRLRKALPDFDGWFCKQQAEDNPIIVTPDGIIQTEISKATGNHDGYIIADVAGESFAKGFRKQHGGGADKSLLDINPRYLSIFALADAFILLLPAKDLDKREIAEDYEVERKADNHDMIESFHNIVGMIKVAHDRIAVNGETPRSFMETGVTGEELQKAFFNHKVTCPRPVSVLYSLADVYERYVDDSYDEDPFLFTFSHIPKLAHAINHFFDFYRFDFLSAFYGQRDESNVPDYNLEHHGAVEAFYWIHEHLEMSSGLFGPWKRRFKGHLPTRTAIKWRRLLDPGFRSKWKRLKGSL